MLKITDYAFCELMFILGQLIHIFWIKIPSAKEKATAAGKKFSYAEWWSCDSTLIIGLNLIGISLLVGLDQIVGIAPSWMDKMKWVFWLVGTFGSSIGYRFYKGYDSGALKLGDIKANLADLITGGTHTVQETIDKAKAMGYDIKPTEKK